MASGAVPLDPNGGIDRKRCNKVSHKTLDLQSDRLQQLRLYMRQRITIMGAEIDAYIIPSYDDHQNETPNKRDRRLQYLTGFTGSDGLAAVTMKTAALWADGRYRLQADSELNCEWFIMQPEDDITPSLAQWLASQLPERARVGADPRLVPHFMWEQWEQGLSIYRNISLEKVMPNNLIDQVWSNEGNRPPATRVPAYVHPMEFAGKTWLTKVTDLRKELKEHGVSAMIVTALDEIAWLLNIRGMDLPYTPVVKSYLIVSEEQLHLYMDKTKLSDKAAKSLGANGCFNKNCTKIHQYGDIWRDIQTLCQSWKVVLLPSYYSFSPGVSEAIMSHIPPEKQLYKPSPIINMRAKKNPIEIKGMRAAHVRDGVAMCEALAYLEDKMQMSDTSEWSELSAAKLIDQTRKSQKYNQGISFATIAGYGPHGALPHYQPSNATSQLILKESTFLLDSGGQYFDGTTDVTRTLHYGEPTDEHRRAYTAVLMASIDLSEMVFPSHLKVSDVDVLARKTLWKTHKDYMHSTGHGIGSFLQAHEAPIQVAYGQRQKSGFKPGYFFSNEPGYYVKGKFGVRLENILEVMEDKAGEDGQTYLGFKDVTLVPYEPKLIKLNMLTQYQRRWLNNYNIRIRKHIGAELKRQMKLDAFYWMMNKTVLIPENLMFDNASHTNISKMVIILTVALVFLFKRQF